VPGLFFPNELLNLAALWLITVLIETPVLYLLNRQKILTSTIKVSLLINLLSYLLFYGYLQFFAR
jgi:nicotinic acid phosphoribosyltransferase